MDIIPNNIFTHNIWSLNHKRECKHHCKTSYHHFLGWKENYFEDIKNMFDIYLSFIYQYKDISIWNIDDFAKLIYINSHKNF